MTRILAIFLFLGTLFNTNIIHADTVSDHETCTPGYFLNDENICEICPAGYFCEDGLTESECFIGFSNTIGATSQDECGVNGIPPGKYIFCDDGCREYEDCPQGYYCPGSDDFHNWGGSWGESYGREKCPSGIGPSGATSIDQCCAAGMVVENNECVMPKICAPGLFLNKKNGLCERCPAEYYCDGTSTPIACPEIPLPDNKYWGHIYMDTNNATGTINDCSGFFIYGNLPPYQEILELVYNEDLSSLLQTDILFCPMVLFPIIFGISAPYENPEYSVTSPMNKTGSAVMLYQYDEYSNTYIYTLYTASCHPGYWAENGLRGLNAEEPYLLETPQQALDLICKPVGPEYWSPGTTYDINNDTITDTGRTACPTGTYTTGFGPGADSADDCRIRCEDGFSLYNGQCYQICGGGVTQLKTSTGLKFTLFAQKHTNPSLFLKYSSTICYANLNPGQKPGTINVGYNGTIYHLTQTE